MSIQRAGESQWTEREERVNQPVSLADKGKVEKRAGPGWSHLLVTRQYFWKERKKENGDEQTGGTLGSSEAGAEHRNSGCRVRKSQKRQKKPRIQGHP